MSDDYSHLSDKARETLELPEDQRIQRIRKARWIGYPRAKEIIAKLEDLLVFPKKNRMPNMLIVGETNNGKTEIARRFQSINPALDNPGFNGVTVPVVFVQAPPKGDVNRFYNLILTRLFAPFRAGDSIRLKEPQVFQVLKRIDCRMLMVDEIQDILAGKSDAQREFLLSLKFLGNELQIPIVGIGTKEAIRALQVNPQVANRFIPEPLPRWHMNDEFLQLLASFERVLPLKKPSGLSDMAIAGQLLSMSEGTIGSLSSLLDEAAIHAIKTRAECINERVLKALQWTPPSEQKRKAERLI